VRPHNRYLVGRPAALTARRRRRPPLPLDRALYRPDTLGLFQLSEFVPEIAHACPLRYRRQGEWQGGLTIETESGAKSCLEL